MHGVYTIQVKSKFISYELKIDRKLIILRGNSATGKTELCRMIESYNAFGSRSGVSVVSDVPVEVISPNIKQAATLQDSHGTIYVADESVPWKRTKEFVNLVTKSDNYFILITRGDEKFLNYGIDAVQMIHTSGKFNYLRPYFKSSKLNAPVTTVLDFCKSVVIEDSSSGLQFLKVATSAQRVSAGSNSAIVSTLKSLQEPTIVVCDGLAYGPYLEDTLTALRYKDSTVIAPDSFEWLLLLYLCTTRPGYDVPELNEIDTFTAGTYERFYTHMLSRILSKDYHVAYTKSKLPSMFMKQNVVSAILEILQDLPCVYRRHDNA